VVPTKAVISGLRRNSTATCSSSRPLKSNRDTGQNTGRGFTVVVVRDRAADEPYTRWFSPNSTINNAITRVDRARLSCAFLVQRVVERIEHKL